MANKRKSYDELLAERNGGANKDSISVNSASGAESTRKSYDELLLERNAPSDLKKLESDLKKYFEDSYAFSNTYSNRFFDSDNNYKNQYRTNTSDWLSIVGKAKEQNEAEAKRIQSLLDTYKSYISEDAYTQWSELLSNTTKAFSDMYNFSAEDDKTMSQFENEEAYKAALAASEAWEDFANYDSEAGNAKIKKLEAQKAQYKKEWEDYYANDYYITDVSPESYKLDTQYATKEKARDEARLSVQTQISNSYSKLIEGIDAEIEAEKMRMKQAGQVQDEIRLAGVADSGSEYYDPEFEEIVSGPQAVLPQVKFQRYVLNVTLYDYMEPEERKILAYWFAKDEDEAVTYFKAIEGRLEARKGEKIAKTVEGNTALQMLFALQSGITSFAENIENFFKSEEDIHQSANQVAAQMVRDDLKETGWKLPEWAGGQSVGQLGFDALQTTGNMLPSILISKGIGAFGGTALGSAEKAAKVGKVFGSTSMGVSAAGAGYQEMISLGYNEGQSRLYGMLVGLSEAGLEYTLGGISSLGGTASASLANKILANVDNAFGRAAIKWGTSIGSEVLEEELQLWLEPFFKTAVFNVDYEAPTAKDMLYTALVTTLSTSMLEGPGITLEGVSTRKDGKAVLKSGKVDRLVELGKTYSADTVAYKLANKIDKNTGAYTIGRLLNEVRGSLSEQNISDIKNALIEKGATGEQAEVLAKWTNHVVEGGDLTQMQMLALENNDVLAEVLNDTIIQPNSTVMQRTQTYEQLIGSVRNYKAEHSISDRVVNKLRSIAGKKASDEAATAEAEAKAAGQNEAAVPLSVESTDVADKVSETGNATIISTNEEVSIKKIASIDAKNKTMKLVLSNDNVVDSNDIKYSDNDQALLYENALVMGYDAQIANAIISGYTKNNVASVENYLGGVKKALEYGWGHIPEKTRMDASYKALTPTQKEQFVKLGEEARAADDKARGVTATQKQSQVTKKKQKDGYRARINEGVDINKLSPRAKESVKALDAVAKALKINIVVADLNGNSYGFYNPATNELYVDKNAGGKGKDTLLFTASHELVHYIRNWSPTKFTILADFLMEQYAAKGENIDKLIEAEIAKAYKATRGKHKMTFNEAYEEVVAQAMQRFLTDSNFIERLAALQKKDANLAKRLVSKLKEILNKIRDAYRNADTPDRASQAVKEMGEAVDELYAKMEEALISASEVSQGTATETAKAEGNVKAQYAERFDEHSVQAALWDSMSHKDEGDDNLILVSKMPDYIVNKLGIEGEFYVYRNHAYENMVSAEQAQEDNRFDRNAHYHNLGIDTMTSAILSLDNPIMTISTKSKNGNPTVIMLLPVFGNNQAPLYAVLSFYNNKHINGSRTKKPHIVLTIAERGFFGSGGRAGISDVVKSAIDEGRVLDFDNKKREDLSAIAKSAGLGNITESSLIKSLSQFRKEVKAFKENNDIHYQYKSTDSIEEPDKLFDEINSRQIEIGKLNRQIEEIENSQEFKKKMNEVFSSDDTEKALKEYQDFINNSDYGKARTRRDKLQIELEGFRKAFNEANEKSAVEDGQKKISDSGLSETEYFRKEAVKEFGYTPYFYDAGYLLPNGRMLNFSGEKGKHFGSRGQDHRAIGTIYANVQGSEAMLKFMGDGNVRVMAETPGIDLSSSVEPTKEQYSTISRFVTESKKKGYFCVDITDAKGNTIGSIEYEDSFSPVRVVNDIKNFYKTGEIREQSEIERFRYQYIDTDSDGNKLTEGQKRYFGNSKVRDEKGRLLAVYHGTKSAGFTTFTKSDEIGYFFARHLRTSRTYAGGSKKIYAPDRYNSDAPSENANYKVYLNLENPYIFDGKGANWNNLMSSGENVAMSIKLSRWNSKTETGLGEVKFGYGGKTYKKIFHNPTEFSNFVTIHLNAQMANTLAFTLNNVIDEKGNAKLEGALPWDFLKSQKAVTKNTRDVVREAASKKRYDGVIFKSVIDSGDGSKIKADDLYVAFDSDQIKSVNNTDPTHDPDIRYQYSDTDYAPTFYSQMGKVVEGVKQEKLAANSVVNMLRGKGVKAEEIRWSGIVQFLEGKKSVTKQELLDFINGSMLQIGEQNYVDADRDIEFVPDLNTGELRLYIDGQLEDTFYKNDNGEFESRETETLFIDEQDFLESVKADYDRKETRWHRYKLDGGENYREIVFTMPNSSYTNNAMQAHWGAEAEGVLAHARIQDFDVNGKKMLFVEEIQSDWHNEGAKTGYDNDVDRKKRESDREKYIATQIEADPFGLEWDVEDMRRTWEARHPLIPSAPFKDNYHEFVLKRLLRMAAEQGYDSIGWTPADIQSKRWSGEFAEGYRIEYDQDIPKFLRKYGRQWGANVSKTTFDGTEVWSMDITDTMKNSVLYEGQAMFQYKGEESIDNRDLLAKALEGAAKTDIEKQKLKEYKSKVALINAEEKKLRELRAQIKEISFSKGPRDTKKLKSLQFEANQAANRINTYDKQLLRLESTQALANVLQREKDLLRKKMVQKQREAVRAVKERDMATMREIMDRYTESRKKAVERRDMSQIRNKIKAFKAKLESNLLTPTDRGYVPFGLAQAMIDVCSLIDTDTDLYKKDGNINKSQVQRNLTKDKLQALKDEYEKLKNYDDPVYSGEFDEAIYLMLKDLRNNYEGRSLKDMSIDELRDMYDILRSIGDTLADARNLIGKGESTDVYEAGDAIISEQREVAQKRKKDKRSGAQKAKDNVINLSLSPVRNIERMSGYKEDSVLVDLFNDFEIGVRQKNFFEMEAKKSFEAVSTGENAKAYESAVYDAFGNKTYMDAHGKKFSISKMQMMQAILSQDRERANGMNHIKGGGLVFADLKLLRKGDLREAISSENSHLVSDADGVVEQFRQELANDKWAQEYMAAAKAFFDGKAKDAINNTMLTLKHRIVAKDKNYIPFEVDKNFVVREISAANDIQQTINSYGMLQETKDKAPQPLIMTGLNNIIDRHIDQVSAVVGLAVPVRNFNKVWNVHSVDGVDTTVNNIIEANWGKEGKKFIEQVVQDIQGPRLNNQSKLYKAIKSGYIGATFLLNGSVVTKQIGSMFAATSMLKRRNPASMMGNLLYTMANYKKIAAEVDKYTASAWMRRQGMSDAEVYSLLTEGKKNPITKALNKLPAIINPAKWITAMDSAVALSLWKYAKQDVQKAHPELSDEELNRATASFYDSLIENTQSMTDVLHRPEIQKRSDIMSEAFGMFKTDLYQMSGQLQNAIGKRKNIGRTVSAIAFSAIWGQLMTTVFALLRYKVNPYRDDEDEELTVESWLKRQSFAFGGDLMGYFFPLFGSEVMGTIENIVYGESEDIADSLVLTAINDLYSTTVSIASALKEGEAPSVDDYKKLLTKSLQVFGIPANNILRTIDAVNLHAKDIANGEFLSFEAGRDKSNGQRLYEAILRGNEAQVEELKLEFNSDSAIESALVKAIQENNPDVAKTASEYINGNLSAYEDMVNALVRQGFGEDVAVRAIRSIITKVNSAAQLKADGDTKGYKEAVKELIDLGYDADQLERDIVSIGKTPSAPDDSDEASSIYKAADINLALEKGNATTARKIIDELVQVKIENYMANGVKKSEAKKKAEASVKSSITSYWKPLYLEAKANKNLSEVQRIKALLRATKLYDNVTETTDDWWDAYRKSK